MISTRWKASASSNSLAFGHGLAALPQPAFQVRGPELFDLAFMTAQGFKLQAKSICNVRTIVDIIRTPEEHFLHFMRFQPFLQQIRIGQMIAGEGINRIQDHLAGDAMIAMPDIAPVGICRCHDR